MTVFAARTRPGPPENGRYQALDVVPDSNGVMWQCVKGGMAGGNLFDLSNAQFVALSSPSTAGVGSVPAAVAATCVAENTGQGSFRRTVLTLTAMPMTIVDSTGGVGSVKIYDFPEGRILMLGGILTLAPTTTSVLASTLNASAVGAIAVGTVAAAADATLTSTEADLIPSVAITHSATINVAAATVSGVLAASAFFAGQTTAIDAILNATITTATDIDADATVTYTGRIEFNWVFLGDF